LPNGTQLGVDFDLAVELFFLGERDSSLAISTLVFTPCLMTEFISFW